MIYVSVGTMFLDFSRLVRKMDEIACDTKEQVVIQIGLGKTIPEHCEYFTFKPHEEILALQREARLVVCHAGIGCVMDALTVRTPLIVTPRLKRHNEHMNDHQMDIAEAVERRGWGRMVCDMDDLPDACAHPPAAPASYEPAKERLVSAVREMVERVAAKKQHA